MSPGPPSAQLPPQAEQTLARALSLVGEVDVVALLRDAVAWLYRTDARA